MDEETILRGQQISEDNLASALSLDSEMLKHLPGEGITGEQNIGSS